MTRDEYVTLLRDTFVTLGVKAVMEHLVLKWSFFALPFVNPVTNLAVKYIVQLLAKQAETAAFFLYIDMRVGKQAKDFESAAIRNFMAQRTGTPEERKDAEEKLKAAFSLFVRLSS